MQLIGPGRYPVRVNTALTPVVRRAATASAAVLWVAATSMLLAPSAAAEPSEGWPVSEPVDTLDALLLLGGLPLLLLVVIGVAVYLPSLMRGERLAPGEPSVENQWLGGPRKSTGELAGPDSATSEAGGASGRW